MDTAITYYIGAALGSILCSIFVRKVRFLSLMLLVFALLLFIAVMVSEGINTYVQFGCAAMVATLAIVSVGLVFGMVFGRE